MKIIVLNNFIVGKNHYGKAVFATRNYNKGDVVCQFTGKTFLREELPKKYTGENDRYVQVGKDTFLGPSGDVDDFINHSCDPNAGLKFTKAGILLVAIKKIKVGDEIFWDSSTTLFDNNWKMLCLCHTRKCRKVINDFMLLDKKTQKKYYDLGIIPPYVKDFMENPNYMVYSKGIEQLKKHERKNTKA